MFVLSRDVRTIAYDGRGNSEVKLHSGMRVHVLQINGSISTCAIGGNAYRITFNVPTDVLIKKAIDVEDDVPTEIPEEEREAIFREIEEEEGVETEEPRPKKMFDPALEIREPGEAPSEEDIDEAEGLGVEKLEEPPKEIIELLEALPATSLETVAPIEYAGKIKVSIPEWFYEYQPAMFTYPDSGSNKGRFLGVENTKLHAGWVLFDLKYPYVFKEIGTVEGAVEIADNLLRIEDELAKGDRPGVQGNYVIRQVYDREVPSLIYQIVDDTGNVVADTKTYDEAIAYAKKMSGYVGAGQ